MTNTEWEVTYFKVATTTSDGKTDSLYANGNMQNPVIVSIKAVEKGTTKRYTLQDGDLSQIELVDYYATTSTLSDGWSYTDQKNEFSNSIGASAATVKAAVAQNDDSPETRKLWVSTTKVEHKNIAARIKQPDGTTITTNSSKFQSFVTLTGKTPVTYTTDNVEFVREDTNNGTYKFDWQSAWDMEWSSGTGNWDQDNYYLSSKVHKFIRVDIHGYDISGYDGGHPGDSRLKNCYAYCAPDEKNLKLSFIWDFGAETAKDAGLYREATVYDWFLDCGRKAYAYPNIKINQKSNALCLTRLAIDCPDSIWGSEWSNNNCGFTVYDMYGNTGKFSAGFTSDHNYITIHNANSSDGIGPDSNNRE